MPTTLGNIALAERAAARLSPLERNVLVLSAGLGLRNGEIGSRLGMSERRAERILARALSKFAKALDNESRPRRHWWWFR